MIKKVLLAAGLSLGLVAAAEAMPANAGTHDVVVGSNSASKFWFLQTTGDCEEASFDYVYGTIKGHRMKESTIDAEAQRLGVLNANPALGSYWLLLPKLSKHYGITMTLGVHSTATLEAYLKAGKHVIATVDVERIWNASSAFLAAYPPQPDSGRIDHALVVDSIDETTTMVTLTDGSVKTGRLETVSLSTFRSAWNYQLAVSN